jgi:glycosyltransferase involved in cell wall biosynthesis
MKFHSNIQVIYSNSLIRYPISFLYSHFENLLYFFRKFKNKFVPNIIISQYHTFHFAPIVASILAKFYKIPYIIRTHDIFSSYYGKLQERGSLSELIWLKSIPHLTYNSIKNADLCSLPSSEILKHFKQIKKFQNQNLIFNLHHNGIDFNEIYPHHDSTLKDQFACENLFLYMGHLDVDHGISNFIRAIPIILREQKETHFVILGSGKDKKFSKQEVKKLKLEKYVHFIDPVPHSMINFYVNNMDVGVGYLTKEIQYHYNCPIKILEYMACKKTFITTKISKDVLHNNNTGLLIESMDFNEIANKSINLLQDKKLRTKLGENGYNIIKNNFQWDKLMNEFEECMVNLVKKFRN